MNRLKRLIEWLKKQRRKHLPTYSERWCDGWNFAEAYEGDIEYLFESVYGSSDAFDEGIMAYWRAHPKRDLDYQRLL